MKGIIEHSILVDDEEICGEVQEEGKYGGYIGVCAVG